MALRTVGYSRVWATRNAHEEEGPVPLDAIGPDGLLAVISSWAKQHKDLTSRAEQIYTAVHDSTDYKHAVLIDVATGSWGDDRRQIVDSNGHRPPSPIDEDDAATVRTRALLIVPPGGDYALYFTEREGHSVGGSRIWDALAEEIRAQPKVEDSSYVPRKLVPKKEVVTLEEDWLKGVHLREVAVTRYRPAESWGGSLDVEELAIEQSVRPKGKGRLSDRWLPRLLKAQDRSEAAGVVGFEGGDDIATITVTVEDENTKKTFEVQNPKTPPMREVLNMHGQQPLDDTEFVDRCGELAAKFYSRINESFAYDWLR